MATKFLPVKVINKKSGKKNIRKAIDIKSNNSMSAGMEDLYKNKSLKRTKAASNSVRKNSDDTYTSIESALNSGINAALIKKQRAAKKKKKAK